MPWRIACAVSILLAAGCATVRAPNIGSIYDRAAQYHDEHRNPVIVIPGILGSKLVDGDSGRTAWGAFSGDYLNPNTPYGARAAALPMQSGAALRDLRDNVRPNGALDRVKFNLLGLPVELNAYAHILGTLGVGGYRDEQLGNAGAVNYGDQHYTCFQFDYDWRRDNVESARRLHEFIVAKRAYVQQEIERRYGVKDAPVKFDIVAHSMGGLVARYFLMYGDADLPADGSPPPLTWAGARYVDKAILVGTPNAGSVLALQQLVDGAKFAPILPKYEPALMGTMPAIYQLLPRSRHACVVDASNKLAVENLYDVTLWERMGWGLASPKQDRVLQVLMPEITDASERRRVALDHLEKCLRRADQFNKAIDVPAPLPAGLQLHLMAGDAAATPSVLAVQGGDGRVAIVRAAPGDGTVVRSSALMDERIGNDWTPGLVSPVQWTSVMFLFTDHLGLTKDPAFTDNVLYLLLEQPASKHWSTAGLHDSRLLGN